MEYESGRRDEGRVRGRQREKKADEEGDERKSVAGINVDKCSSLKDKRNVCVRERRERCEMRNEQARDKRERDYAYDESINSSPSGFRRALKCNNNKER